MSHRRVLGLLLLASFGVWSGTQASASAALPAFVECAKVKGAPLERGCAKEAGRGGYELRDGTGKGKPVKGRGGVARLVIASLGAEITCASTKLAGTLGSSGAITKVLTTFSRCVALGGKCTSPGAKSGTIQSAELDGDIGLLPEGRGGLDLKPEIGTLFTEFACGSTDVTVEGSVVGEVTPVNQFTKTVQLSFGLTPEDTQLYRSLEGEPEDVLTTNIAGIGVFESGLSAETTNRGEDLLLATQRPCVETGAFSAEWWSTRSACQTGDAELGGVWRPW